MGSETQRTYSGYSSGLLSVGAVPFSVRSLPGASAHAAQALALRAGPTSGDNAPGLQGVGVQ